MRRMPDKEQQEAVRRALDPKTVEASMLAQRVAEASNQVQQQVRGMLHQMLELVPGQLFRDIQRFHEKFELPPTDDHGHRLPDDLLKFRIKCLYEEVQEYVDAVGGSYCCPDIDIDGSKFDAELALDSLVDLAYFCLGTAYLHGFNFDAAWQRVHEANMKKVRAESANDPRGKRGHASDVVKPANWQKPILKDLL
jgi:Phosphoribosyl-ATP pyrophosphohydrolase